MKIQPGTKNIFVRLWDYLQRKEDVALSTIIETRGSSPQVPGASALFSQDGLIFGTVGGGILEADIQDISVHALQTKRSQYRVFKLDADLISEEGAICGGEVCVLIDGAPEMHKDALSRLVKSLSQRRAGMLITCIDGISGGRISVQRAWMDSDDGFSDVQDLPFSISPQELESVFSRRLPGLLKGNRDTPPDKEQQFIFLEPVFPLPQLLIAGAGHIGQAVAHLGHLLDFEVTVIDDRSEFACQERLPEADRIIVDDIGKAVRSFPVSSETFVVIVTRGHRHDGEALRASIDSKAAYIGMIGSRSKIKQMRQQFLDQKWATPDQFDMIHAPIGLDINSETIQEIAISIAAQLVLVRRQILAGPEQK